ncbi:MAG: hypothetical protein QNK05_15940 [Myxococcota bacterium]|nr:hypothetical protein [Myxococcota bacterium]
MEPSLTPVLLMVELAFLATAVERARRGALSTGHAAIGFGFLAWVAGYAVLTSVLGARGAFVSEDLLRWAPGLWLQVVTVVVCVGPVVGLPRLRDAIRETVDATPWTWWAGFHALRMTALGTLVKAWGGEFPAYFGWIVGIPDFLFGVSALWIWRRAHRGRLSRQGFLAWNLVGALIIVPAAPLLLHLGLPGPSHVFQELPDARAVLTFPMSIAPLIGVPLFVLTNLCVAWRSWELGGERAPGVAASMRLPTAR